MKSGMGRFARAPVPWLVMLGLYVLSHPGGGAAHPRSETATPKKKQTFHTVRRGETLGRIASLYGISVRALIESNRLNRPDVLTVGQRLLVPGKPHPAATGKASYQQVPADLVLSKSELDGRAIHLLWPLDGPVSSDFGRRRRGWHRGIDVKAELGTPIQAAAAGAVIFTGWERLYGRVVKIEHEGGFVTVYAHNLQNFVEVGDQVAQGQIIGTVGRTGRATTYHLHFEIRDNGRFLNPLFLLPDREIVPASQTQPYEDEDE